MLREVEGALGGVGTSSTPPPFTHPVESEMYRVKSGLDDLSRFLDVSTATVASEHVPLVSPTSLP
jgi:hypothetical protein